MIKLLLVEDNTIVREGIAGLLRSQPDIEVIGEACGPFQALEMFEKGLQPDIVLVDLNMPDMDGIELTGRICALKSHTAKIIILTMHTRHVFVDKAFKAGARGYLLKNGEFEEMYDAIRQVSDNKVYVSAGVDS